MTALPSSALADYIASPFGTLHLEGIHIDRFRIDRATIQGREAAINLQECILAALDEIGPTKSAGSKVAPKYRNPANPSETWSGRGRQPRWLATLVQKGKEPSEFLIK